MVSEKLLTLKKSFRKFKEKILIIFHNNNRVLKDCTRINMNRIFYLSVVAAFMRVLDIILFTGVAGTSELWYKGILASHTVLLFFYTSVSFITARMRKIQRVNTIMRIAEYTVPVIILLSGIVIVTIDQLVTTSITPFLIVCVVPAAIFLIRPLVSIIIYIGSYFVYYNLISLTITDHQVLLSNRVNGATMVALGLLISIMTWHYNYVNITQRRRIRSQQKQLKKMAYHDSLTNLYNRHFFDETIKNELLAIQYYGHESAILLLDIDNFKNINDTYGHLVGDQVLVQLAKLITYNIRSSDIVSRFGGEEFIILMPRASLSEGCMLAEKLRKLISEEDFIADTVTLHITVSFGVSLLESSKDYKGYFSNADKALYLAKNKGKNRVEKVLSP